MIDDRLNQIRNKISKLSSMGVDTQGYEKELNSITSKKYNSYGNSAFAYSNNIRESEIKKLESELNDYDLIIEFYNYCNKIKPTLLEMFKKSKDEINLDELNSYISKIEDYLINLKHDKNNTVNLTKIYEIVYYLIELEIILTNKSTLYDFINDKDVDTRYINSIIMNKIKDANKIKDDDSKKILIKKRLDVLIPKLNKDSSNYNYFNIEIIKLLLMLERDYDAYKELEIDFDLKLQKLSRLDKSLDLLTKKTNSDLTSLSKSLSKIKKSKIKLQKKIISTLLTLSVILTGTYGIERGVKKFSTTNSYSKKTEIISTLNNNPVVKNEEYISDADVSGNEQYIDILTPWRSSEDSTFSRDVLEYDITSLGLNVDNLDDIDTDSIRVEPNYYIETISKEDQDELQMYDEPITELRNISYTYQGKKLCNEYGLYRLFFYVLYIFLLMLIFKFKCTFSGVPVFLDEVIDEFKNNKYRENMNREYFEINLGMLLEYINQNKELRKEFNKLFVENIDLLSDTKELKNRLDTAISEFKDYDKSTEMILKRKNEL